MRASGSCSVVRDDRFVCTGSEPAAGLGRRRKPGPPRPGRRNPSSAGGASAIPCAGCPARPGRRLRPALKSFSPVTWSRRAAGDDVQCRSWVGVQPQARRFLRPSADDPERPTCTGPALDLRQHIHGSILVHRREPPRRRARRTCPRPAKPKPRQGRPFRAPSEQNSALTASPAHPASRLAVRTPAPPGWTMRLARSGCSSASRRHVAVGGDVAGFAEVEQGP